MKLKKETKENIVLTLIVIAIIYLLLFIFYPRDVEQPLPPPLDLPQPTAVETPPAQ